MTKRFLSLALLLTLLLPALIACHGNREHRSFIIPEEFDESKEYEITFWAKNDTNITQTEIYAKAIEDFEALYPNIKVNMRLYTDYGKIYNDVITNIATDTTPNVCITYPDHIATYMTGEDTVVPLDGLFADHTYHRNMRGSIPPRPGSFTVYATGFSPIDRTIEIFFSKRRESRPMHAKV